MGIRAAWIINTMYGYWWSTRRRLRSDGNVYDWNLFIAKLECIQVYSIKASLPEFFYITGSNQLLHFWVPKRVFHRNRTRISRLFCTQRRRRGLRARCTHQLLVTIIIDFGRLMQVESDRMEFLYQIILPVWFQDFQYSCTENYGWMGNQWKL